MLENIAYASVLGKPLIFWLGITTFALLLATAYFGVMAMKGKAKMEKHKMLAMLTLVFAIAHAFLSMAASF